ncbi:paREP2b [Pyrobaculum aerophilum str. IM2]|nr:paREP2b [Pyrobaculum aerophilum str. IM2]
MHKRGLINEKQRDRLLKEINAGPNVVEIVGLELSVSQKNPGKSKTLLLCTNQPLP